MIANQNPQLTERLAQIWKQSVERLTEQAAAKASFGYVDLTKLPVQVDALKLIEEKKAREIKIAAFERKGNLIAVAALDPQSVATKEAVVNLKKQGFASRVFLVSPASLAYAWTFYQYAPKNIVHDQSRVDIKSERVSELEKELVNIAQVEDALRKMLLTNPNPGSVLEVMLAGALVSRASDVHFEPGEKSVRLRYRIDGALRDIFTDLPRDLYQLLLSRVKILSNLRLNVSNVAQDGRFTIGLGDIEIELRVSAIPSEFGETIVLRVLDPRVIALTMADLGMRSDDLVIAERQLKSPNGMILNTGPTGSGKTTTLYAFLQKLLTPELKIITIEDPIEYHLAGIEQTQVDAKSGYTFSNGLQAIMRQDPDAILVGEIRDKDTAGIAIQAALTGHLVFSTLHTNSAAGVIPRLLDLGAPQTSIGPALNLIIAQRLIRRLCLKCKKPLAITPELDKKTKAFLNNLPSRVDKSSVKEITLFEVNPVGCGACHQSGYRGRVGIFELFEVGEEVEFLINKHASEGEIQRYAFSHGLVTLQQDAALKAFSGLTSLAEVENVTGPIAEFA